MNGPRDVVYTVSRRMVLLVLGGLVAAPAQMSGQDMGKAAIDCLEESLLSGEYCENPPPVGVYAFLFRPDEHATHEVRTVLEGLERLALGGESDDLRLRAANLLSLFGTREGSQGYRPVQRLERVYYSSSDGLVRTAVLGWLHEQSNVDEAVRFLEAVAAAEEDGPVAHGWTNAKVAIERLAAMGDRGRAVLRRLHETDAVANLQAKGLLEAMAKNGYRMPTRRH